MGHCVYVDKNRCKGCELCVAFCPRGLLRMSSEINAAGSHFVEVQDPDRCTGCLQCVQVCPDVAIEIRKTTTAAKDVDDKPSQNH